MTAFQHGFEGGFLAAGVLAAAIDATAFAREAREPPTSGALLPMVTPISGGVQVGLAGAL